MHLFCGANGAKMGSGHRFARPGAPLCTALVRENDPQRVGIDTLHQPVQARYKQIPGLPGTWSNIYCAVVTAGAAAAAGAPRTVGLRPCTWKILYLLEYNWIQADTSLDFLYGSGAFRTKFLYGACTTLARSAPNRCMSLARCRADCLYLVARRSYRRYMQLV